MFGMSKLVKVIVSLGALERQAKVAKYTFKHVLRTVPTNTEVFSPSL